MKLTTTARVLLRRSAILLIGFLILTSDLVSAQVVCRESGVSGMDRSKARALRVISSKTTRDVASAKVYVEYAEGGSIYYHSNFITTGFEFTTKIAGKASPAMENPGSIFSNIVYDERPSDAVMTETARILRDDIELLLDVSMFDKNGRPRIDLTGVKNAKVVDGATGKILAATTEILRTATPPPSAIAKIKGCCLFGRPPHLAAHFSKTLSEHSFNPKDARILSLVIDGATDRAFNKSATLKAARLKGDSQALKSVEELEKIFRSSKGTTLITLGHVEGTDYVMRTASNREQVRVPIAKVRAMARENDILLIDIGCMTAQAVEGESMGLGVMTKYNTVNALKSVETALRSSKNLQDVLTALSANGELRIVLDKSFVRGKVARGTIYSRAKDLAETFWVRVASIAVSDNRK